MATATAEHKITVEAPLAPVPELTVTSPRGKVLLDVAFAGKSRGRSASWVYDFGDGCQSHDPSNAKANHKYSKAGTYTVRLTLSDAYGQVGTAQAVITVDSLPTPQPSFTASPTKGFVPQDVTFAGRSSGSPVAWEYDFGDGAQSTDPTKPNTKHEYDTAGH